ncbi:MULTISPECIES: MFS transporter [Streptomyces]|uniref:MFS transporter n=1 Tax=Streptomyces caniscabiei TaxID=2746961 RepID=A0ABU4N3Y9_9ACTN|nr:MULTISPECIES: MFS transporter [Streptomyces]MBE4741414.1 MFS transporter [Streptomyces caniscabiei]MBE4761433.1 MFS transporter [Streptomyces caniscabiei]MBE4769574.1 MFS transporter [Streptomyces caniscabiei]MBE4789898.1 MFS transporter [Streptomyces caniscabiei]MBE4799082.1 MFS transporter [Streptomyces caniscabiei]
MTAEALAVSRPAFGRRQVHAVAACYFVASFAALGLPPYFTQILPELGDRAGRWAGVLYVVPTVFSALAAPLWGRLADRFGRKRLLLRAQLGLAVSFLLAGWADSLTMFTAALVLQGILGGTFAASNGYLGAALDGPRLSRALTLMQGSARAALVFAPIVVGALSPWLSPHRQYALLALLPLAAALLLAALPEPAEAEETDGRERVVADPAPRAALRRLYALEFAFVFSTVISFPYLISLVQERLPGASAALSGLLFALPHLCYLLTALAVHRAVRTRPRHGIALGFALIALGLAGHGVADTLPGLVAVRLVLGAGLTFGMVGLSVLAADCARGRAPGGMFGSLEFFSKAGAVAAGVTAAVGSARFGPAAPVLIGGGIAALTVFATLLPPHPRTRWSH